MFAPGSLRELVRRTTAAAQQSGALEPIATQTQTVEDQGLRFIVRIVESLKRKASAPHPAGFNPFLPYDERLFVAAAGSEHVCLLNKFSVVNDHLLIVTRRFEPQQSRLTEDDFHALLMCLAEYPSLGFYNSGQQAGASQAHKHLQLIPLPLSANDELPMQSVWRAANLRCHEPGMAALPFPHQLVRLAAADFRSMSTQGLIVQLYRQMLQALGLEPAQGMFSQAYNLLITREWMLLVARTREESEGISLNAMAFAGALLVRDQQQLARVRAKGPMQMLCDVAT